MAEIQTKESLLQENQQLRARLEELEETLRAIHGGEVDALVVSTPEGEQIYTLMGADQPYRVMIEAMSESAVTLAQDGTILYCNSRFAELVKMPHEQIIGQSIHGWIATQNRKKFDSMLTQGWVGIVHEELALQAGDGARVPVKVSLCPLPENVGKGIATVITDLTELKQVGHNLNERLKELRTFYYLSELAERNNFSLDSLYQEVANVLPESWQYPEITCARIVIGEKEYRTKNFSVSEWMQVAPINVYGSAVGKLEAGYLEQKPEQDEGPFLKEERQLINAVAERVGHITARKRAEEELRKNHIYLEHMVDQRTAQFEAVTMELEGFAYSISHDLRVPLRAIDGFSRILLKHYEDKLDDEGKRYLNLVRDNTKKMNLLFDDILALSRMGRQKMAVSEIDMEALVRDVFEELKPGLSGRELTLEIKPLPLCRGDQTMLRQAWSTLLDNAVKFTRHKTAAWVEVGGRAEDKEQVYFVKDNGAGFDMQYADRLFGVFQRLHSVEDYEGTGVGLAIVKRIITRHGGRVWAEGKVDEGATFYFALPVPEAKT